MAMLRSSHVCDFPFCIRAKVGFYTEKAFRDHRSIHGMNDSTHQGADSTHVWGDGVIGKLHEPFYHMSAQASPHFVHAEGYPDWWGGRLFSEQDKQYVSPINECASVTGISQLRSFPADPSLPKSKGVEYTEKGEQSASLPAGSYEHFIGRKTTQEPKDGSSLSFTKLTEMVQNDRPTTASEEPLLNLVEKMGKVVIENTKGEVLASENSAMSANSAPAESIPPAAKDDEQEQIGGETSIGKVSTISANNPLQRLPARSETAQAKKVAYTVKLTKLLDTVHRRVERLRTNVLGTEAAVSDPFAVPAIPRAVLSGVTLQASSDLKAVESEFKESQELQAEAFNGHEDVGQIHLQSQNVSGTRYFVDLDPYPEQEKLHSLVLHAEQDIIKTASRNMAGVTSSCSASTIADKISSKLTQSTTPTSVSEGDCAKPNAVNEQMNGDLPSQQPHTEIKQSLTTITEQDEAEFDNQDTQSTLSEDSIIALTSAQQRDIVKKFSDALLKRLQNKHIKSHDLRVSRVSFRRTVNELIKEYSNKVKDTTPRMQRNQRQAAKCIRFLRQNICHRCVTALETLYTCEEEHQQHPKTVPKVDDKGSPQKTWEEKVYDWQLIPCDGWSLGNQPTDFNMSVGPSEDTMLHEDLQQQARSKDEALSSASLSHYPLSSIDLFSVDDDDADDDDEGSANLEVVNHISPAEDADLYVYLTAHGAFDDLVSDLGNLMEREFGDRMEVIRHKMLIGLRHYIHQQQYGAAATVVFAINDWDVQGFLRDHHRTSSSQDLGSVLTITGQSTNAYLTSVRRYLAEFWSADHETVLTAIEYALVNGKSKQCAIGNPKCSVDVNLDQSRISATGTVEFLISTAQQLSWLIASCRTTMSDLSYSRIDFRQDIMSSTEAYPVYCISANVVSVTPDELTSCWNPLLRKSVIVTGFQIPDRSHKEQGLEIPIEIMAHLGGAGTAVQYGGGYLLKGRSIMFVPVRRMHSSVQWHLIAKDKGKMQYRDVSKLCPERLLDRDLDEEGLLRTRAFLGWCSETESILATNDFPYSQVNFSSTRQPSKNVVYLVGGSLGFQYFGAGNVDFSIRPGTAPFSKNHSGFYEDRLEDARQIPVILQDLSTRRAWQTDGERAILNFILHRNDDGNYKIDEKKAQIVVTDKNAKDYVRRMTTENADVALTKDRRTDDDTVRTRLFRNAFCELYEILEGLQAHSEEFYHSGMRLSLDFHQRIQGYEYMDVLRRTRRFALKEARLTKSCGGWPDLARDTNAVVLFGINFGEVVQSTSKVGLCRAFDTVPKDKDYLTIQGSTLRELYLNSGAEQDQSQLTTTGRRWHRSRHLFELCPYGKSASIHCKCERIQTLLPSTFTAIKRWKPPGELPLRCAAIFGQASRHPFTRLLEKSRLEWFHRENESRRTLAESTTSASVNNLSFLASESVSLQDLCVLRGSRRLSELGVGDAFMEAQHKPVAETPTDVAETRTGPPDLEVQLHPTGSSTLGTSSFVTDTTSADTNNSKTTDYSTPSSSINKSIDMKSSLRLGMPPVLESWLQNHTMVHTPIQFPSEHSQSVPEQKSYQCETPILWSDIVCRPQCQPESELRPESKETSGNSEIALAQTLRSRRVHVHRPRNRYTIGTSDQPRTSTT